MRVVKRRRHAWRREPWPAAPWPASYTAELAVEWGQDTVRPDLRSSSDSVLRIEPQPLYPPLYRVVLEDGDASDTIGSMLLLHEAFGLADTL